jgi:hypothetical protein
MRGAGCAKWSFCWLSLPFLFDPVGLIWPGFRVIGWWDLFRRWIWVAAWPGIFGIANLAQRTEVVIFSGFRGNLSQASVAQLAEQLICNQQVVGSSPSASSSIGLRVAWARLSCPGSRLGNWEWRRRWIAVARIVPASRRAACRWPLVARRSVVGIDGGFPERSKGSDCKSDGYAFTGSNPVPPT